MYPQIKKGKWLKKDYASINRYTRTFKWLRELSFFLLVRLYEKMNIVGFLNFDQSN